MRWLLLVIACGGCDLVFQIDHLPPPPACAAGDEDCDGTLDASDLCPADADMGADDDGDAVGDACDPERGLGGNHIVYFDGFNDNTGNWTIKSGAWALGDGVFAQPQIGDSRVEKSVMAAMPSVEVVVPDFQPMSNGFITLFGGQGGNELHCSVIHTTDGKEVIEISGFLVATMQTEVTGTGPLRIMGGQLANNTLYCHARRGNNFDATVTAGALGPVTIDTIGILTSSASATVSSITLYDVSGR